jgi:hypothetical protein
MTHKATVKNFCMEQLNQLGLSNYYNETDFNCYYSKHRCGQSNAFIASSNIADYILTQANSRIFETQTQFSQIQTIYHGAQY